MQSVRRTRHCRSQPEVGTWHRLKHEGEILRGCAGRNIQELEVRRRSCCDRPDEARRRGVVDGGRKTAHVSELCFATISCGNRSGQLANPSLEEITYFIVEPTGRPANDAALADRIPTISC